MPISSEVMRLLLVACQFCMAFLGALYLRRRSLSFTEYIKWGLLLVLVPVLGPFLVILSRPGRARP